MLSAASEGCAKTTGRAAPELRFSADAVSLLHELLHAMGQPLTTLQLCRVPAARGGADEDGRKVLGEIAGQVESLTEMYRAMRLLVEGCESQVEVMEVGPMVRRLEEGWRLRASRQRVALRVDDGAASCGVLGGTGVEQALDQIFGVMLTGIPTGSAVELLVRGEEAEVIFYTSHSGAVVSETWGLRVARVLLGRAGGSVVYTGQPMCAGVRFARA